MELKKINKGTFLAVLALLIPLFVIQCTKSTAIGSDLVNGDESNFFATDTLDLKVKTIPSEDSLLTFVYSTNSRGLSRYLLGQFNDPIFGINQSEIIVQYGPSPGDFGGKFVGATVDSVVMTIVWDSAGFYGQPDVMQSIGVFQLKEKMRIDTSYYSFQDLEASETSLGQLDNFIPNLNKRLLVVNLDSTVKDSNLVYNRIVLNSTFGQELLDLDSVVYTTAEGFSEYFKGLKIKVANSTDAMMAVRLNHGLSEIDIYYQTPEEDSLVFRLHSFGGYPATKFLSKDYMGSIVESHINVENDETFFMQSTGGLNIEVELPSLSDFDDIIVNKAVLEFVLDDLAMDDTTVYKVINNYELTDSIGNSIFYPVPPPTNFAQVKGTVKLLERDGVMQRVVQFNVSHLMQNIKRGEAGRKIIIKPDASLAIGRSVFQGFSGSEVTQPKLFLNITEL